jgi:transketolase
MIHPKDVRRIILDQSRRANVGHIGSCLCVVEILCALYGKVLRAASPSDPDRDRFILSKGHAALALYAALALKNWIDQRELDAFCGDNTALGVHPEHTVSGIDFSTGSLGHGLAFAAGAALAARMQRSNRRVYCLISDAECNEGSLWESVMFAACQRLGNLTAIIDLNGQQAFGLTRDVMDCSNLGERWRAFGWAPAEVDGHSVDDLTGVLSCPTEPDGAPRVMLARTVFGKGVRYMEQGIAVSQYQLPARAINWHYLPMTEHEYNLAISDLEES